MNDTISEQRDQITSSIEYAKKIQKAILPSNELMKICLPFSYVFYEPRDIVSGDFYWVSSVDKKVLVACADSTGHGVPGAIVSMIGNNGLNNCINEYGLTKPSQILDALTKYVEETFDKSVDAVRDGMDIALCLIDFENNKLEYSGANIPLYTTRGTELSVVKPDKQPIGKYEYRKPFTNHTINLVGVDNIYMCSDGIQDQFGGAKGKKFKIRRLKRLLMELSQQKLSRQKEMLKETFMEWKDGQEQVDDVCFIGITITND
jgi:serine phosphatase RsbU (regulator of sigma subunit)